MSFPNETPEYRAARDALLTSEIALRRHIEAVAAQLRALPPGGEVPEGRQSRHRGTSAHRTTRRLRCCHGHPENSRPAPGLIWKRRVGRADGIARRWIRDLAAHRRVIATRHPHEHITCPRDLQPSSGQFTRARIRRRARRSDRVRMHAFALSLVRAIAIQQASSGSHTADLVSWSRGR